MRVWGESLGSRGLGFPVWGSEFRVQGCDLGT